MVTKHADMLHVTVTAYVTKRSF